MKRLDLPLTIDKRLLYCSYFAFAILLFLMIALFVFQVMHGDDYVRLATENRLRVIRLSPQRGTIFDANQIPLAVSISTFSIQGYPLSMQSEETIERIASFLGKHGIVKRPEDLKETLKSQYTVPYRSVTLVNNLTLAQMATIVADPEFPQELVPVSQWRRVYPAGEVMSHVVGYVGSINKEELKRYGSRGYQGGDEIGKSGVEAKFEHLLRGNFGGEAIEVDARGRLVRKLDFKPSEHGKDVVLTLDLIAQQKVSELMEGKRGGVIVMDVQRGDVVVLYSSPSYDPNPLAWGLRDFEWRALTNDPSYPMMNRVIGGIYSPASTFKIVAAIAGLAEGVITPKTTFYCPGYLEVGNRRFRCIRPHGREDIVGALRDSCNVFFFQLGLKLGVDVLSDWAYRLGFGRPTGISLPGEATGNLAGRRWKKVTFGESWYLGDTANYVIGQGFLLVTPIQLARSYAAVANGGFLPRPRLIEAEGLDGEEISVDDKVLSVIRKGLEEVVKSGTGRAAGAYGVKVAGKTGTAQTSRDKNDALFVGYAPADSPKYVIVVLLEEGESGGRAVAPLAGEILAYLLKERRE
ncbi:penicillin-binding protein 2 [Acetomicrobium hydrogeniformans]|uniref:Beta-lactamase n=1 Tax=Acetomicrobium hydrogeniformans TaxID=649746 RepID=A0A7V7BXZ1_9BACT|nr:penicillin-binding protein 2 [Acetomicrobium hydrogeniformans]HHZ04080.1 penicillin-binding protein 2 [Acetomicrobium hydrogeniformans]